MKGAPDGITKRKLFTPYNIFLLTYGQVNIVLTVNRRAVGRPPSSPQHSYRPIQVVPPTARNKYKLMLNVDSAQAVTIQ